MPVQFGNDWMKKIQTTAKIGRDRRPKKSPGNEVAAGRVQFGCQRNFLNPIISKLDKHVVLLHIISVPSKVLKGWFVDLLIIIRYLSISCLVDNGDLI